MWRCYAILILLTQTASAEFFRGPIAQSEGGAGRAGLQGMESAFVNPALIPLIKASEVNLYYLDGDVGPHQHRNAYGVGLVDSDKEVLFPGTLQYLRLKDTGRTPTGAKGELWHAAFGKNFSDHFAAGASVYRLVYDVEGDRAYTQWNGSLGVLILLADNFGVAYVLDNIAKPGSEIPLGLREDLKQGAGVFGSIGEIARIRADISRVERFNPQQKLTYAVGLESMTSEWFLTRIGFRRDELADTRFWTAGLGFNGPRLKVDYAFEKNAKGTGGAVHSVDLRVPF